MDDCRRYIAAGKVQRWDVVKWGVTVILGLATATALRPTILLFVLAVAVAIGSWLLVLHYNRRMAKTRQTAKALAERLQSFDIDYKELLQIDVIYPDGENHDKQELTIFGAILGAASFLVLVMYAVSSFSSSGTRGPSINSTLTAPTTASQSIPT